jgi:hypothetical protein
MNGAGAPWDADMIEHDPLVAAMHLVHCVPLKINILWVWRRYQSGRSESWYLVRTTK